MSNMHRAQSRKLEHVAEKNQERQIKVEAEAAH